MDTWWDKNSDRIILLVLIVVFLGTCVYGAVRPTSGLFGVASDLLKQLVSAMFMLMQINKVTNGGTNGKTTTTSAPTDTTTSTH